MFIIDLGAQSYYSMFGLSPTASFAEIAAARENLHKELLEKQRQAKTEEEKQKHVKRQAEFSAMGETLGRPEKRKEYDRAHAHLGFFVVQVAAAPLFVDKGERLYVLHRIIRGFLADKGVELQPLSDLDREDFSTDETPVALLDKLLAEVRG